MMSYRVATFVVAAARVGCRSYHPVTAAPRPGSDVRVVFARPIDVRATGEGGGLLLLPRVEPLEGSVLRVSADTVLVALTRTRPRYLPPRRLVAPTATIVRAPGIHVEALRVDPVRTAGAVVGGSMLAAVIAFAILAAAMAGS